MTEHTSIADMAAAMEAGIEEGKKNHRNLVKARRAYMDEIEKLDPDFWDGEINSLIYWLARRGKQASECPVAAEAESAGVIHLRKKRQPASHTQKCPRARP